MGVILGLTLLTPVSAHLGTPKHLWTKHIKQRADKRYDQRLWAVVRADGTLARGNRAAAIIKVDDGFYRVRFNRNVRGCAYQATVGSPADMAPVGGQITVGHDNTSARGAFVLTTTAGGSVADQPFHLAVDC